MAAPSAYVKTNTMGFLTLTDGLGNTLTVPYDKGDFSLDGLGHRLNEVAKSEGRGRFFSAAYGARRYPGLSFSAFVPNIVGGTAVAPGTLAEFLSGLGAYASNQSTLGVNRPMAVKVKLTIEGSAFGDSADETVEAADVICTFTFAEAVDGNTISISGEVLGTITVTNSGNTVTYSQISAPPVP